MGNLETARRKEAVRNHEQNIIAIHMENIEKDLNHMKVRALIGGVQICLTLCTRNIIAEQDSEVIVNIMNEKYEMDRKHENQLN